jgi:hypothetical protein
LIRHLAIEYAYHDNLEYLESKAIAVDIHNQGREIGKIHVAMTTFFAYSGIIEKTTEYKMNHVPASWPGRGGGGGINDPT